MSTEARELRVAGESLKVALLTYRGTPTCGGQGVYIRHLSRELVARLRTQTHGDWTHSEMTVYRARLNALGG